VDGVPREVARGEGREVISRFIIQTAAAHMPSSCKWGPYRRVAVLEVRDGVEWVAMISDRARGVVRVVATWERCNVGRPLLGWQSPAPGSKAS
jgi:hypothetical protein